MNTQQSIESIQAKAYQYGWSIIELSHALSSVGVNYGNECQVKLANGRVICTPAHPNECEYVRIVQDGHELAYWTSDEWAEDAAVVMGAILGCAKAGDKESVSQPIKSQEAFEGADNPLDTFHIATSNSVEDSGTFTVDIENAENDDDFISVVMQVKNCPISSQPSPNAVLYFDADNIGLSVTRHGDEFVVALGDGLQLESIPSISGEVIYKTKSI